MARSGLCMKNTPKIPPGQKVGTARGAESSNTLIIPKKYPRNTKNACLGYFSVCSGYFLEVPEFWPGGYFFRFFFSGNSGSGPNSVAGRGVFKAKCCKSNYLIAICDSFSLFPIPPALSGLRLGYHWSLLRLC